MKMFESYDNLSSIQIPGQMLKNEAQDIKTTRLPYEEYNAYGELIGYWWYYGDTVNLEFNISGVVTDTGSNTYMTAKDFLSDKSIKITLYNFRREEIYTAYFEGSETVIFPIDSELSNKLLKGIYYCSLKVLDNTQMQLTLYESDKQTLLVK